MRISREETKKREAIVRNLFRDNPALSGPAANQALYETVGAKMNTRRLYELRTEVRKDLALASVKGQDIPFDAPETPVTKTNETPVTETAGPVAAAAAGVTGLGAPAASVDDDEEIPQLSLPVREAGRL